MIAIIWLVFTICAAILAGRRGRSRFAWCLLTVLIGPIALLLLVCLGAKETDIERFQKAQARARLEADPEYQAWRASKAPAPKPVVTTLPRSPEDKAREAIIAGGVLIFLVVAAWLGGQTQTPSAPAADAPTAPSFASSTSSAPALPVKHRRHHGVTSTSPAQEGAP